ncbi:MAG: hypothetical protein AAGG01_19150 [Planctomycetota bacterium]
MHSAVTRVRSRISVGALGLFASAAGLVGAGVPSRTASNAVHSSAVAVHLGPLDPHVSGSSFARDVALEAATLRLQELADSAGPIPDDDRDLASFLELEFDRVEFVGSSDGSQDEYIYVWRFFEGVWIEVCVKQRSLIIEGDELVEPLRLDLSWTMPA